MNFRRAIPNKGELESMRALLFEHGKNDWNYLPEAGIDRELSDLGTGKALAVLMEDTGRMVGLAIGYPAFIRFPDLEPASADAASIAYVGDVAIHREYVGKGHGTELLQKLCGELISSGARTIYIACHE